MKGFIFRGYAVWKDDHGRIVLENITNVYHPLISVRVLTRTRVRPRSVKSIGQRPPQLARKAIQSWTKIVYQID